MAQHDLQGQALIDLELAGRGRDLIAPYQRNVREVGGADAYSLCDAIDRGRSKPLPEAGSGLKGCAKTFSIVSLQVLLGLRELEHDGLCKALTIGRQSVSGAPAPMGALMTACMPIALSDLRAVQSAAAGKGQHRARALWQYLADQLLLGRPHPVRSGFQRHCQCYCQC